MVYLRFLNFAAYAEHLNRGKNGGGVHLRGHTHLDIADLSNSQNLVFYIVATHLNEDATTIAICEELVLAEEQAHPDPETMGDDAEAAHKIAESILNKQRKRIETTLLEKLDKFGRFFKAEGLTVHRGIYTTNQPHVLLGK